MQALIGLCKIEIKRWKAASEDSSNMRYMVTLMETALAALTAEIHSFTFEEDPQPLYTTPPAQLLHPVELPQSFAYTIEGMEEYIDGWWLRKDDVIEALRQQGYEVKS